jgi:hypothetical protein
MKYKANAEEAKLQLILSLNKVNYRQEQQFFESYTITGCMIELTGLVQLIKIYQM